MSWARHLRRSMRTRDITVRAVTSGAVGGRLYLEREGQDVILEFGDFVPSAVAASSVTLPLALPTGFWPPRTIELPLSPRVYDAPGEIKGAVRVRYDGTLDFYRVNAGATARGQVRFRTRQPFPASDPGEEVP